MGGNSFKVGKAKPRANNSKKNIRHTHKQSPKKKIRKSGTVFSCSRIIFTLRSISRLGKKGARRRGNLPKKGGKCAQC